MSSSVHGQGDDGVLIGIAMAAAFAAGLIAVAQHAGRTSAGYQLAIAEREGIELRRVADQAQRRVSSLRTPQAATARVAPMKLTALKYPNKWNVANAATIRSCAAALAVTPAPVTDAVSGPGRGIAR